MPKCRLLLLLLLTACDQATVDPPQTGPTYYQDIAPILSERCASCHQAGSIAGSIPLTTYEEVAPRAAQIMDAVRSKRMPPSVVDVSGACGEFRDPRILPNDELMTLLS